MSLNRGKIKIESSAKKRKNPYKDDIIWDSRGQWAYPGLPTRIPAGDISMMGVPYPMMGVADNGMTSMMYPDQNYNFPGAKYVDEYPVNYGGYYPMGERIDGGEGPRLGQIYD